MPGFDSQSLYLTPKCINCARDEPVPTGVWFHDLAGLSVVAYRSGQYVRQASMQRAKVSVAARADYPQDSRVWPATSAPSLPARRAGRRMASRAQQLPRESTMC